MAEKHTEHITYNYISKLLNIKEYNTKGNKQLFKKYIPDGWLQNGNNLLIIENKGNEKQFEEGINQLLKYAKTASEGNENINIYCILSTGTTEETHIINYFKYNKEKENLKKLKERQIKEIFSNVSKSYNCQSIHNMFVKNFHFDKSEELHDMITVIISSFINDDLKQYYKMKDEMITKEFITLLIDNARDLLGNGYDKYLKIIQETEFKNAFKTCKVIYEAYKQDPHLIANLFQQCKKYNKYELSKNEIWTEPEICKIMFHELDNIIKNDLHKSREDMLTVCDPCIGGGNLLKEFMQKYNNLTLKGCDINKRLLMNNKLELIIKGYDIDGLFSNDYFEIEPDKLKCDVLICNPPYSKNISKHDCLQFVNKSLEHSKYCCYIIPKNKLLTEKKQLKQLLNKHSIIKIINIGEIFKHVAATGEIIIMVASKKKHEIKTKYIDISELSNEYYKVIRKDEFKFTDKGLQILNSLYNDTVEFTEYELTTETPYPIEQKITIIDNIKNNIIKKYENEITRLSSLYMSDSRRLKYYNELITDIETIRKIQNIYDLIRFNDNDFISDNSKDIIKVKLMDVFELVKFKPTTLYNTQNGNYPLYGATINDEPIKYINNYNIEVPENEEYIQLNKVAAGAGYCFIRTGKFSLVSSAVLLKLKKEYKHRIYSQENMKLITLQISNMGFGFSNGITNKKLNNIEIYIIANDKNKTEQETEQETKKITFKISERFNIVEKIKNYKYSTQGEDIGKIPLFACKKLDNGIAKYVDKEEYEGNVIIVVHHRDATCGYAFNYCGKLAWNPSCYVIEPKEEFKDINTEYIAKYITLTIAPNHLESEHFNKEYLMNFVIEYPSEE